MFIDTLDSDCTDSSLLDDSWLLLCLINIVSGEGFLQCHCPDPFERGPRSFYNPKALGPKEFIISFSQSFPCWCGVWGLVNRCPWGVYVRSFISDFRPWFRFGGFDGRSTSRCSHIHRIDTYITTWEVSLKCLSPMAGLESSSSSDGVRWRIKTQYVVAITPPHFKFLSFQIVIFHSSYIVA